MLLPLVTAPMGLPYRGDYSLDDDNLDTIMLAEQMNQYHKLDPSIQYDFYFSSVRKARRFGFPKKTETNPQLENVIEYFGYSRVKAEQALQLLSESDLCEIRKRLDKGGV